MPSRINPPSRHHSVTDAGDKNYAYPETKPVEFVEESQTVKSVMSEDELKAKYRKELFLLNINRLATCLKPSAQKK